MAANDPSEREVRASLERDAGLMRELRATEMWDCLVSQFKKMEARALQQVTHEASDMEHVHFWRGQLSLIQEVQKIPDLIIRWAADNAKETEA